MTKLHELAFEELCQTNKLMNRHRRKLTIPASNTSGTECDKEL